MLASGRSSRLAIFRARFRSSSGSRTNVAGDSISFAMSSTVKSFFLLVKQKVKSHNVNIFGVDFRHRLTVEAEDFSFAISAPKYFREAKVGKLLRTQEA
jgi:hypothetical protein